MKNSIKASSKNFTTRNFASCLIKWKDITRDQRIRNTVRGSKIKSEVLSHIPLSQWNNCQVADNGNFCRRINHLLKEGIIVPIENNEKGYISSMFFKEKKDYKFCLILNLNKFNRYFTYRSFKIDNLKATLTLVRENFLMARIDLKDAYYSV